MFLWTPSFEGNWVSLMGFSLKTLAGIDGNAPYQAQELQITTLANPGIQTNFLQWSLQFFSAGRDLRLRLKEEGICCKQFGALTTKMIGTYQSYAMEVILHTIWGSFHQTDRETTFLFLLRRYCGNQFGVASTKMIGTYHSHTMKVM